jgi:hypothetical protein
MIPKEDLQDLYIRRHLTMAEIGKIYSITRQRVWQLLKEYEIDQTNAERFIIQCDRCKKEYSITRKKFRMRSTHYCSMRCYLSDRKNEDYRPHRNGQREARKIMSGHIGRALQAGEIIHHLDGNCQNNDLSNLVLFPNHSAHVKWHHLIRQVQYVK